MEDHSICERELDDPMHLVVSEVVADEAAAVEVDFFAPDQFV